MEINLLLLHLLGLNGSLLSNEDTLGDIEVIQVLSLLLLSQVLLQLLIQGNLSV